MPRRRRRQLSPVELLIVISIAGILLAITASSRPSRGRSPRHSVQTPAARPLRPAIPVEPPDAAKQTASPPSVLRLWRRVQGPLALALALHVISRAFRRGRRARPTSPVTHGDPPAP